MKMLKFQPFSPCLTCLLGNVKWHVAYVFFLFVLFYLIFNFWPCWRLNPVPLHARQTLYHLSHTPSPSLLFLRQDLTFFFFFNGTGIWAQGLILARPHPFFALIIFPVGSQVFAQGLRPQSFYIYSHSIAGITGAHHHTQLIDWDRVSLTFRPGCLELRSCWSPSPE
jgi:hypothetical protein